MTIPPPNPEPDRCFRRHALWCISILGLCMVVAYWLFCQDQTQNVTITTIATRQAVIMAALEKLEATASRNEAYNLEALRLLRHQQSSVVEPRIPSDPIK